MKVLHDRGASDDDGMAATPRMTATEADTRFATLAGHRDSTPARQTRRATIGTLVTLVLMIAFCHGIGGGAAWPGRPLFVLMLGVPLLLIGSQRVRRPSRCVRHD